jgi:hypothetical protein
MFSLNRPARNIHELASYLKSQHNTGHLYRGQNTDYGRLVPSVFRRKEIRTWNRFCVCSEDGFAEFSDLETAKHSLMEMFMREYGRRFGKYLAQQYLAQSEVVDVTENIDVAAFFATMPYPTYTAPISAPDKVGVVYRFEHSQFAADEEDGPFDYRKGSPLAVSGEPVEGATETSIFVQRESKMKWSPEEFYFSPKELAEIPAPGLVRRNFATPAVAVSYTEMQSAMAVEVPDIGRDIDNVERRNYGDIRTPLPFLRPIVQRGGIIMPGYLWSCLVPENVDRPLARVWGDYVMGVEDVYGKYGMQAFYFWHAGKAPEFTRNLLWPNVGEDETFFVLGNTVSVSRDGLGIAPNTFHMADIVDIGFSGNIDVDFSEYEEGLTQG